MKKVQQGSIINHVGEWQICFEESTSQVDETKEKKKDQLSFEDILKVKGESK